MESWEDDARPLLGAGRGVQLGHADAMQLAADRLKGSGGKTLRIGVERAFLPADAEGILREGMPEADIVDALVPLERLRAVKSPARARAVRMASERVVDSMLAVFAGHGPGTTKQELAEALRREEV